MKFRLIFAAYLLFFIASLAYALEPNQILVIANGDIPASAKIVLYYCEKRSVPQNNILMLHLGTNLKNSISKADYEKLIAEPVRKKLSELQPAAYTTIGTPIRCLLTVYGVPFKVDGRGQLKDHEDQLIQLKKLAEQEKNNLELLKKNSIVNLSLQQEKSRLKLAQLQSDIDYISGKETNASLDSELSMVLFGNYELYRWQPNNLKSTSPHWDHKTLMVCRLDGPGEYIAIGLIDKAISTEKTGLNGIVYIDSRGITDDKKTYSYGYFDQSLRNLAAILKLQTNLQVKLENTAKLFEASQCPKTAIYCGWYSLKKYIDAFDFVDGAIGYHISSLEAVDLRDSNSSQWCPAMLKKGITATLGAVAEPYLHAFPEPDAFFTQLLQGCCLVEAYYHTQPFNSWQLVLIGDPLYKPFKKPRDLPENNF